jgi:threonylcarbamoyladenosine tRNA methylthiotransferase MtaB
MPHLHLPLQSGSSALLKRMCRQYSAEQFAEVVEAIKARLDRPAITTDIIVGFPGETDDDFQQTVRVAEHAGFSKMHIFPFSAREGTAAARMQDTVDTAVIKERSQVLRDLGERLGRAYRGQFIGQTAEVLIETAEATGAAGRGERYFSVEIETPQGVVQNNDLVTVRLQGHTGNGLLGSTIPAGSASSC